MANIRVDLNTKIQDGTEIVFRSPVDCSAITGLIVYYPGEDENTTSKEFALADAHGNNVGDIDNLFAENVVVKVILDVTSGMAFVQNADTNAYIEQRFADIEAELFYVNIDITKFTCPGAGTYEIGTVIDPPTVTWTLNKDPESQTLNGEALGVDVRSKAYTDKVTTDKTYTLNVTGQKGETDTASASIKFLRGVYYGVLEDGAAIDSAAILKLTRKLQGSRAITFTATAGANQRHAFAMPSSGYGTPTFKDAETGFQAGFYKASTFQFTNASGHMESYDVWLSTNKALGSMTVAVS